MSEESTPVVDPVPPADPTPVVVATSEPVVINQVQQNTEETIVVVENNPPADAKPSAGSEPAVKGWIKRSAQKCFGAVKWFICLPMIFMGRRRSRQQDSLTLCSVDAGFFLWVMIVAGFLLAWVVRLDPLVAVGAGWAYAWLSLLFFASIMYDLNAKKLAIWSVVFFAVWMALKYGEDVQHWIVLGTITHHLATLDPKLDPGYASVISWLSIIPFGYSVFHMLAFGQKRFTPNEVCEYRLFEGDEYLDRQGVKFKTRYRDILETLLTFGGGDIIVLDNHGAEFKRFPNMLFLYFLWPKLERIIEQRAVVEDGGESALKRGERQ